MTLNKGIIHLREIAEQYNKWAAEENENGEIWERENARLYKEAAKEYSQYAEWLEELKHYKEQETERDKENI